MPTTVYYPWGSTPADTNDLIWGSVDYTWSDVCVILSIIGVDDGGSGDFDIWQNYQKLQDEDKKKFITILFKVKGQMEPDRQFENRDFTKRQIAMADVKVTLDDVKLVVENFKKTMSVFLVKPPKTEN